MSVADHRRSSLARLAAVCSTILLAVATLTGSTMAVINAQGGGNNRSALPMASVEACRVPLTDLGKSAAFSGTALYTLDVGQSGAIQRLEQLRDGGLTRFVNIPVFEACLRRWRFGEPGKLSVLFTAGTTGDPLKDGWRISVSGDGKQFVLAL